MKKYDHMTVALDTGEVLQMESGSVSLENPLGKERTFFATNVGPHGYSTKRVVSVIKGKVVFTNGKSLADYDFIDARITLRDTESGARMLCYKCCTGTLGALGSENPEIAIGVLGEKQEL
jgi:hypothetical protein